MTHRRIARQASRSAASAQLTSLSLADEMPLYPDLNARHTFAVTLWTRERSKTDDRVVFVMRRIERFLGLGDIPI